jgi:hypothetical protein
MLRVAVVTQLVLLADVLEVRVDGLTRRFPRTALGVMRAVAYALTFEDPISFWVGNAAVQGASEFLAQV